MSTLKGLIVIRFRLDYCQGGPLHPVIVTIGDGGDYISVLLYSSYTLNPKP